MNIYDLIEKIRANIFDSSNNFLNKSDLKQILIGLELLRALGDNIDIPNIDNSWEFISNKLPATYQPVSLLLFNDRNLYEGSLHYDAYGDPYWSIPDYRGHGEECFDLYTVICWKPKEDVSNDKHTESMCPCYEHNHWYLKDFGTCNGTKEREPCSCNGIKINVIFIQIPN